MAGDGPRGPQGRPDRELRVAHIREDAGADYSEVVFLESARFYRVLKQNPAYGEILRKLRAAADSGRSLGVRFASPEGDVIAGVT